jgi:integrase
VIDSTPKIQLLTGETRRERVVSPEEEKAYLAVASPLFKDVATLLFDTGMRPDELHRMQWQEITWTGARHGTILITTGKTAAARRQIPMTKRVREVWSLAGRPKNRHRKEAASQSAEGFQSFALRAL